MTQRRIIDLQEQTSVNADSYVMTDNATQGSKKYNLKTLFDQSAAANAAATAAAAQATAAKEAADAAAGSADDAAEAAGDATKAAYAAIEAMGDISELAVPEMSEFIRGGAKLGDGLTVDSNEKLNLGPLVKHSTGVTDGSAIYGVQGEGYARQSGTPTPSNPQPIMVARGRNLMKPTVRTTSAKGVTYTVYEDGKITLNGTCTGNIGFNAFLNQVFPYESGTYTASLTGSNKASFAEAQVITTRQLELTNGGSVSCNIIIISGVTYNEEFYIQLELGTTPTPYVPYGHVGLEVTANGQTTVTPVPLPSKGFLGALPDGTKDTLAIDSAGGVVVGNVCNEIVLDGSTDTLTAEYTGTNGKRFRRTQIADALSTTSTSGVLKLICTHGTPNIRATSASEWLPGDCMLYSRTFYIALPLSISTNEEVAAFLQSSPLTVLYPLATPTTESLGYIDLPALPEGATVNIPELDNVGVDYWIKGIPEVTEYGLAMLARLQSEIDEVEQAVADLSAAVANL